MLSTIKVPEQWITNNGHSFEKLSTMKSEGAQKKKSQKVNRCTPEQLQQHRQTHAHVDAELEGSGETPQSCLSIEEAFFGYHLGGQFWKGSPLLCDC